MYRDRTDGALLTTWSDIRQARPTQSLPVNLEPFLDEIGIDPVHPAERPIFDQATQRLELRGAVIQEGRWIEDWAVVALTPEEQAQAAADRMAQAKAERQAAVDAIQVTTQAGHTFDGDETSQGRMARALVAMDAAGVGTTTWVLANNTPTEVTRADLLEALVLAGQEQTRLWMQPWEA